MFNSSARHTALCHSHTDLNSNLTAASIKQLGKEKRRSKEGLAVITRVLFCFRLCVFFCSIAAALPSSLVVSFLKLRIYFPPWSAPFGANGFVMIRAWPFAALLGHMLPKISLTVTTTSQISLKRSCIHSELHNTLMPES